MKSTTLRALPLTLLGATLLCLPQAARATVVWTATFESGDESEWTPGINGMNGARDNVEVLSEEVFEGNFAGKVTIHPDDTFTFGQNRVDIQHQSMLTDDGEDLWLSGHYFLPQDAQVRNQLGFFESNESFQNVMDFWVSPKQGGGTELTFGVGFLGETELWTGDFTAGVWHQIAIHVHWSQDEAVGAVDFWLDGVQVVTDYKTQTKVDGNTLFFQTGLHRTEVAEFTEIVYIDDFIEADTFAEAQIMAPMGLGGAAGMGGEAGMGGMAMAGSAGMAVGGGGMGGASMIPMGGAAGSAGTPTSMGGSAAGAAGGSMSSAGMTAGLAGAPSGGSSAMVPATTNASSSGCAHAGSPTQGFQLAGASALLALAALLYRRR